ncbi:MAG: hypothetical protein A2402_02950 [Candidatus Staskawiczbacteria bacterium RIFOXYC1_FULL_37_43]|nr:MAG: hypothetical protein A2813_03275 [Candidatus Staskawiczbacteria bacterium RIFCSPHIGHO2_01_FULL_37_17]OGZ71550.1 MAG: hypothetical protein A2891_02535 [Candidatus Staskawiczbacteria bacterium RIFCSPLOWO2_01_FULL_37_19]OGZ76305.1 MAG: hypothetical protein A2205_00900 [Candidatus Staskawiczbacteria bacterium RIFOXYA1_FULL_37_15]OGZ80321.1 MAG: hypothetical protein A2353_03610 [Candidatus Staskawiczbacteria bacterium RIFOXYB1_FULL_38_37]OGZ81387.1 MAG: hypothetical protein A2325_00705 [Cand
MAEETQQITKKDIQELLSEQTTVILTAVDEKMSSLEEKIKALDLKFSEKFDKLTTTLDNFLKRMTDIEDEFAMMRADINRVKDVIKQKLGVDLT